MKNLRQRFGVCNDLDDLETKWRHRETKWRHRLRAETFKATCNARAAGVRGRGSEAVKDQKAHHGGFYHATSINRVPRRHVKLLGR